MIPFRSIFNFLLLAAFATTFAGVDADLSAMADDIYSQAPGGAKSVWAVLPFESRIPDNPDAGQSIAEFLITVLGAKPGVEIVDRSGLDKALEEIALTQTGAMADQEVLHVGKLVAARFLLAGSVTDAFGRAMVNARLMETETGRIVASKSIPLDIPSLRSFTKEVLSERRQISASIFRSAVVPGWGQFYTNHPVRGWVSFGAFGAGVAATVYAAMGVGSADADYKAFEAKTLTVSGRNELSQQLFGPGVIPGTPGFEQATFNTFLDSEEDHLWNSYEDRKSSLLISIAATGAVWALNLSDAALCGMDSRRKIKLHFSATPMQVQLSRSL